LVSVATAYEPKRTCIVSFHSLNGDKWVHVTSGSSLFDVVRAAMRFFADPFWRGPKPRVDTVFTVTRIGGDESWEVRGARVR
jgi:hypothetical protein